MKPFGNLGWSRLAQKTVSQFSSDLGGFFGWPQAGQWNSAQWRALSSSFEACGLLQRDISHPAEAFLRESQNGLGWGSEGLKSQVGKVQSLLSLGEQHWRTSRGKQRWKNLNNMDRERAKKEGRSLQQIPLFHAWKQQQPKPKWGFRNWKGFIWDFLHWHLILGYFAALFSTSE